MERVITAEAKKDLLIARLVEARQAIMASVSSLPLGKQDEVFLGVWSIKDLLAHLVGWDYTNRAAVAEILAGQVPSFYAQADRDWQSYNASLVQQYRRKDLAEMLALV